LGGDLGADPAVGEPQVDDGKVRPVTSSTNENVG